MKNKTLLIRMFRLVQPVLIGLAILCVVFCVLLTVGDGVSFPNWDMLFESAKISPANNLEGKPDFLRVIDVGQGDAMLFYSKGCVALLDTGPADSAYCLCDDLERFGVHEIDLLMLTHSDSDHVGNVAELSEKYKIHNLLVPQNLVSDLDPQPVLDLRASILSGGGGFYTARQGMVLTVGNFEFTVLACYDDAENTNNRMMYLMAEIDGKKILLTGDGEDEIEQKLLDEGLDLSCDILKVPHHGSNSSTSKVFLKACHPTYSVISCGAGNKFGHPNDDLLQRLESSKTGLYRTDMDGNVTFTFKNGKISVKTKK